MRFTIVGCAAAWGRGPEAASSCYLVEAGDDAIVLDLGHGAFAPLSALRPPETVAAVLISHPHPDHCVDLIPLRHYLRYEAGARPGTLALHVPAGLPQRFDALTGESGFLDDLRCSALVDGEIRLGSLLVTAATVTHVEGSFAFRVAEAGGSPGLVYSGDCGEPRDLVRLIEPGDTLLCEASFGDRPVPPGVAHLDAAGAARAAREGRASRLILTHLQAHIEAGAALTAAQALFGGECLLARSGLAIEL